MQAKKEDAANVNTGTPVHYDQTVREQGTSGQVKEEDLASVYGAPAHSEQTVSEEYTCRTRLVLARGDIKLS